VLEANEAACKALGYSRDELVGMNASGFSAQYTTAGEMHGLAERVASSGSSVMRDTLRRKDGSTFPVEVRLAVLGGDGEEYAAIVRDVTERDAQDLARKSSEDRYRDLVEMSPNAVFVHVGGKFTYVNRAGLALLGAKDPSELLGKPIVESVHPDDRARVGERLRDLAGGSTRVPAIEERFIRLDGTPVPVEVVAARTRLGDVDAVQVIAVDITERKKAALEALAIRAISFAFLESASLGESCREIVKLLSESLQVPLVVVHRYDERSGEVEELASTLSLKEVAGRKSGSERDSLSGRAAATRKTITYLDVATVGEGDPAAQLARESGARTCLCIPMTARDQVLGVLAIVDSKVRQDLIDQVGRIEVIANHLAQEIARRNAEEALRDSERRHRALFDEVPVGLWEEDCTAVKRVLDELRAAGCTDVPEHLRNHPEVVLQCAAGVRVVHVNQAAADMCGASDEPELLGGLDKVFVPESFPQFREQLIALAQGRSRIRTEGFNRTLQGEPLWVNMQCSIAPGHEHDWSKLLVSTLDMTEQKRAAKEREQLEERLRQSQKMEAIGTLAGGVAHDFNNILAAILGFGELAMLDLPQGSRGRADVEQIMKAAFRARDLVQQILAFSRQTNRQRTAIDPAPIIKEALTLLRAAIPANVDIRTDVQQCVGAVLADPTELHQVLMNLCSNARWALRDRETGVLEVKLQRCPPGDAAEKGLPPGDYVCLSVRDDGCGMDAATKERIFEPYFTTKKVHEGSGLGLSVVHGVVTGCGGAIRVESAPAQGTTFHLFFPRLAAPEKTTPAAESLPPRGTEHLLLVDDEPAVIDIQTRILTTLGYQVTATTSSLEALELFRAAPERFAVVVSDQALPHMTGTTLAAEMKLLRPDLRVVFCTGCADMIDEQRAKDCGGRALLIKPVDMRTLAVAVRRALDE